MNPIDMTTGDPNISNRPSVFTELYPPSNRTIFNWNTISGVSQSPHQHYGHLQNPGFNMNPHLGANWPNFQFSSNQQSFGQTAVQFPFSNAHQDGSIERPMCSLRCKRKTDSPPLQPTKQLITEEKMSEHLSKLHISSETPTSDMESEQIKERRLYMCEEMKKFQAQTESIIPESLLSSLKRPCTALVLWKPPSNILVPSIYNHNNTEESENENINNNSSSIRDNNPSNLVLNKMEFEEL